MAFLFLKYIFMIIKLIQQIKDRYSNGIEDRSSNLRSRFIYTYLLATRSLLIYQQANKNKKISKYNFTDINCIKLIRVSADMCPCAIPSNCFMLRSELKIPKLIDNKYVNPISYVVTTNKSNFFDEINIEEVDLYHKSGNKFAKDNEKFFYSNNYLYFPSSIHIEYVSAGFLLRNPIEANKFKCKEDENICIPVYELDFNINPELEKGLIDLTFQSINGFNKKNKDIRNDSE